MNIVAYLSMMTQVTKDLGIQHIVKSILRCSNNHTSTKFIKTHEIISGINKYSDISIHCNISHKELW